MSQYSIEFFDLSINNVHHDIVDGLSIDDDYLSLSETSIEIAKTDKVSIHNLIYIQGLNGFLGIVTKVSIKDYVTEIAFKPFISLFDQNILLDTNTQGKTALETVIADEITNYWISSSDSKQNISSLQVSTTSLTKSWGMNLKSDNEDMHHCIIGFYSVLISKAMSKYGIVVNAMLNFDTKKIVVTIGKNSNARFVIDADLENVKINTFSLQEPSSSTNKLEVWNDTNYSGSDTSSLLHYYLHSDGSYDKTNSDRITPVVLEVTSVSPQEEEGISARQAFINAADEAAVNTFSGIEWTNLIELEMSAKDGLIKPLELKFGQEVAIVHDGSSYPSILTGKNLSDTVTLVFGVVRHDLTKILKSGG